MEPSVDASHTEDSSPATKPRFRGVPHLAGFALAIPAGWLLIHFARAGSSTRAVAVYAVSLVLLLGISAVYHTPNWRPRVRAWLRRVDHAMIFVLIGGSLTPICVTVDPDNVGFVLPLVWGVVLLGALKSLFWASAPALVRTLLYVAISWSAVLYLPGIYKTAGLGALVLLLLGGVTYTTGAYTYARRWPDPLPQVFGYHEVWHVMVVFASAFHYAAIWQLVV